MTLLQFKDLKIDYVTRKGVIQAVDGISFDVNTGENIGIVGESGCGKTTVAKAILKILPENAQVPRGQIYFMGNDLVSMDDNEIREIRWKRISMISQSAMNALNPVYRIEKQLMEILLKRGSLDRDSAQKKCIELFEMVGLNPGRLRDFPHQFSGGMKQRVAIAMALALNPDLIIADEPTTALDVISQDQVLQSIHHLQKKLNKSMILITHDISIVAEGCDKIAVMYAGKLMEYGNVETVFQSPCNPYTVGLRNAFPSVKGQKKDLISIPGSPPNLIGPLKGCRFYSRCPFSKPHCAEVEPETIRIDGSHLVACHEFERAEEIRSRGAHRETWESVR